MKLMFCQDCGDLVVPAPRDGVKRLCQCGRHGVWWKDGAAGVLRVEDTRYEPTASWQPRAWVIGLDNDVLTTQTTLNSGRAYSALLDQCPEWYLFKRYKTLVVRIRPGESGDTRWAHMAELDNPGHQR